MGSNREKSNIAIAILELIQQAPLNHREKEKSELYLFIHEFMVYSKKKKNIKILIDRFIFGIRLQAYMIHFTKYICRFVCIFFKAFSIPHPHFLWIHAL